MGAAPTERLTERRRADTPGSVPRRLVTKRAEQPDQADTPLARRQRARLPVTERHHTEPVAATRRDVTDRDRNAFRDVGLPSVGRTELHRRGRVEHEPGHEHTLGEVHAHMRLAGARSDVPVDVPHVVHRRDVGPHLRELRSLPEE